MATGTTPVCPRRNCLTRREIATIEQAVNFYTTDAFRTAPHGFDIVLSPTEVASGNSELLTVAVADTQDAIDDLAPKSLNPAAVHALHTVKLTLSTAQANPDANRPAFLDSALIWLDLAKQDLFSQNPNGEF